MAVYKVPQDVEADDKLIGPFSFRQFIYLIIVAICIAIAWFLSKINLALAIIPLPVIVFFLALSLPLRKDQPMEAYLSAVISFYFLKSRKRLWQPDGIDSFVTIIAPKNSERRLTKNFDQAEANERLNYLAQLVDTHGWAIRGDNDPINSSLNKDLYYESQSTEDMFDKASSSVQVLNEKLAKSANERLEGAKRSMKKVAFGATEKPPAQKETGDMNEKRATVGITESDFNETRGANGQKEEPTKLSGSSNIHIEKTSEKNVLEIAPTTSVSPPKTDTIGLTRKQAEELSQNNELSVKTLAEQANRIVKNNKEALLNGKEVMIHLR